MQGSLVSRALLLCVALSSQLPAQRIALSFDDGLNPDREPRGAQWNAALLGHLRAARVQAVVFPALRNVGDGRGRALIADWARAGHLVGNHTWRHRNFGAASMTLAEFITEIQVADTAFRGLPTWRRWLRFPFLKEGDTEAKRDGLRAWMDSVGYRAAPVSIDASDWYYNEVFLGLDTIPGDVRARRRALVSAYVTHLLDRTEYYDSLARRYLGRRPAHVLLLHVNAINAHALPAVLRAYRRRGWSFVAPETAYADALYARRPRTLPAGESIIWAIAREQQAEGLRYPAEDAEYEEPRLRAAGVLPLRR